MTVLRGTARADRALVEMQRQVADAVVVGVDACDATDEQVAASIHASRARMRQYRDGAATIDAARLAIAPAPLREAVLRVILGDSTLIILPPASASIGVEQAIRAQRETGEALSQHLSTIATRTADGRVSVSRADGATLERECDEAIRELLRIREAARIAVREGVYTEPSGGTVTELHSARGGW